MPKTLTVGAYEGGALVVEQADQVLDRAEVAAFGERALSALLGAEAGRPVRGVDLKVNFLEIPAAGSLRAEVRLVHRTRRTALVDCIVTAGDTEVARIAGTYLFE